MKHTDEELNNLADELATAIIRKYLIYNVDNAFAKYKRNLTKLIFEYLLELK